MRWSVREALLAAAALNRAADCEAEANDFVACLADLLACLARSPIPGCPMDQVLGLEAQIAASGAAELEGATSIRLPLHAAVVDVRENSDVSPTTTRQVVPDQACADAVDLARRAAEEDAGPGQVGAHVAIEVDADRVATHLFESLDPGYAGWRWAVTVTRAARAKTVTVSESVLLPGPDSLLAPAWVPWTERIRPGDLKAGDLMPAGADDERLVPFVTLAGDAGLLDWDESPTWPFGRSSWPAVGEATSGSDDVATPDEKTADAGEGPAEGAAPSTRPRKRAARRPAGRRRAETEFRPARVLSPIGRDDAAARWHSGGQGPSSPLASAAPAPCVTCGFFVRLSGPLGRVFGVCANEFAPDDGKVVSVDHGCGAHSDGKTVPAAVLDAGSGAAPAVDELGYDMLNTGATVPESVLETMDHELA